MEYECRIPYNIVQVEHHHYRKSNTGQGKTNKDNVCLICDNESPIFDAVHLMIRIVRLPNKHGSQIVILLRYSRKPILLVFPFCVLIEIILKRERFLLPRVK